MEKCKVSIIVPVYNVEDYLEECLESAINQSLKDIEIIAVDDGSTDKSSDILKKYEKLHSNVKVITQQNKGLSAARNTGIEYAKGEYIYFLDSDDYIDDQLCKKCYEEAIGENLDIIFFDADVIYQNEELQNKFTFSYGREDILNSSIQKGEQFYCYVNKLGGYKSSACLMFFKKKLLIDNQLSFFEGIVHEDDLFTPQLIIHASKVKYIPKRYFYRRVRPDSIMTKEKNISNAKGYLIVANELNSFLTQNQNIFHKETINVLQKSIDRYYLQVSGMCFKNRTKIEYSPLKKELYSNYDKGIGKKSKKIKLLIKMPFVHYILGKIKNSLKYYYKYISRSY
ncbi:MAG: glycosyltransferase family 2 protein [Cellulosilyticaceae bacterium]